MIIDNATINQIIASVFEEMLAMTTEFPEPADIHPAEERVVASIRISGSMDGLVILNAPAPTASQIGETMFSASAGSLQEEEIHDAVGEIVNMIGGNIKGLSEGDSALSLPCVSRETGTLIPYNVSGEWTSVRVAGLPLSVCWQHRSSNSSNK